MQVEVEQAEMEPAEEQHHQEVALGPQAEQSTQAQTTQAEVVGVVDRMATEAKAATVW